MAAVRPLPRVHRPCLECPWKRTSPPGQFDACRYEALTDTAGTPGAEAPLDAPIFACHKTQEGGDRACAGWLAVVGRDHLGVRFMVATGRLDPAALEPGPDWPPLYESYAELAVANGVSPTTRGCHPNRPPRPAHPRHRRQGATSEPTGR